jgi:hypothetical protein
VRWVAACEGGMGRGAATMGVGVEAVAEEVEGAV